MKQSRAPQTRIALTLSLALLIFAVGTTLSRSPPTVVRSNSIAAAVEFTTVTGHFAACQRNEVLPRNTSAIRLSLDSTLGPRIKVRVLRGKRLLTSGERGSGWTAADVTVPLRPIAQTTSDVSVCFAFLARDESVGLTGERLESRDRTAPNLGLIKIEYLAPGSQSWLSLASSVAANMALGHAWSGIWVVPFLAAVMISIVAIVSWLALRLAR